MRFLRNGSLALLLVSTLIGCGGEEGRVTEAGSSPAPAPVAEPPAPLPPPPTPDEPAPVPVALECVAEGFPCSLNEVPSEILNRGDALADSVIAMLDARSSADEALNYLRSQADVTDVASNELALRFRLAGGRDVFILEPEALAPVPSVVPAARVLIVVKNGVKTPAPLPTA